MAAVIPPTLPPEPGQPGGVSPLPPDALGGSVITCNQIDGTAGLTAKMTGGSGSLQSLGQGTTLVLEGGGQWFTPGAPLIPDQPFLLPKTAGTGWVAIRSSAEAQLIAASGGPGQRINPVTHAQYMPRILSTGQSATFNAFDGAPGGVNGGAAASGIRFVGIEMGVDPAFVPTSSVPHHATLALGTMNNDLGFGVGDRWTHPFPIVETMSQRHAVERCWIHGNGFNNRGGGTNGNGFNRGLLHSGGDCRVIDSLIEGYQNSGQNTQCFWSMGPGPFYLENNYMCCLGQCFMTGGTGAQYQYNQPPLPGEGTARPIIQPTGIIIRRCLLDKGVDKWDPNSPNYDFSAGPFPFGWQQQAIANLELKFAKQVLIEATTINNSWSWPAFTFDSIDPQDRDTFGLRRQTIEDVTVRNCLVTDAVALHQIDGASNAVRRIHMHNILAANIRHARKSPFAPSDAPGTAFSLTTRDETTAVSDLWYEHITALGDTNAINFKGGPVPSAAFTRIRLRNCILGYGDTGVQIMTLNLQGQHCSDALLDQVSIDREWAALAMVQGPIEDTTNQVKSFPYVPYSAAAYGPPTNAAGQFYLPSNPNTVASKAGALADTGIDWDTGILTSGSAMKAGGAFQATDLTDNGVDHAALNAALAGVATAPTANFTYGQNPGSFIVQFTDTSA